MSLINVKLIKWIKYKNRKGKIIMCIKWYIKILAKLFLITDQIDIVIREEVLISYHLRYFILDRLYIF